MRNFYNVLINTLIANVTTSFLWFALTFWIFLETRSVLATSIIGGGYFLMLAVFSIMFGTIVDHNKKKHVMVASTAVTFITYSIAGILFLLFPEQELVNWNGILFWLFTLVILLGAVVENMRNIALSTTVTLLVPAKKRANANGLVGAVQGVAFVVTSVFSGLAIGFLGMGWTLAIAIILTGLALLHIAFVRIPEKEIAHDPDSQNKRIDLRGSIHAIKDIPGLGGLIIFTTFNNLVGGVFIALIDPYGLSLVSVQSWGFILGVTSTGFILGGLLIAKFGLGKKPLRTLLIVNIAIGLVGMLLAIRETWLLLAIGNFAYMLLFPFVEAAEQTIIQKVVPFRRQGRVFGFATSVETAAAPVTAFVIGPLAQFIVIPYVQSDAGAAQYDWLLGSGDARGIALIFLITGFVAMVVALLAFWTRTYRRLSHSYENAPDHSSDKND